MLGFGKVIIVIITDNRQLAAIFEQVCDVLAYTGLHLTTLASIDALIQQPDLVIADGIHTNGTQLSQSLRTLPSYVPVLWLMPANTQTDAVQHVLCKPFTITQAIQAIQKALRQTQHPPQILPEALLYAMLTATSVQELFYVVSQYLISTFGAANLAILRLDEDMAAHWLYWYNQPAQHQQDALMQALSQRDSLPPGWYRFPFIANDLQGLLLIALRGTIAPAQYQTLMEIGDLVARVWQRETALASSREYIQSLQAFEMMGRSIVGELDLQTALESAVRSVRVLLNCALGMIWLVKGEKVVLATFAGAPAPHVRELPLDLPFVLPVILHKTIYAESHFSHARLLFDNLNSYHTLAVPLMARDQVIGMVQAVNIASSAPFSTMDEWRLRNLASWCVIAISNADLHQRVHTALKRERAYRDRIIQAEKLSQVGQLVATVAHEVNNPLQIINAGVSFLQQQAHDPDMRENLDIIDEAATQIERVVWRIRESYEVPERDVSYFDINELLTRVSQMFRHQLQETNTVVELHLADDLPVFTGFAHEIREVIINLVKNAIEAVTGRPDGIIWLSSAYEAATGDIIVTVQDNGIGIPDELQETIFDMFFTTKSNGSGIGLAISQDIVVQHGGKIGVESSPGGTLFSVRLPAR